jgi:hypothetical protein
MTQAITAAQLVQTYCRTIFPNDPLEMECIVAQHLRVFKVVSSGSHKYIPADKLSKDIGAEPGSGVYGYEKMEDGSFMLYTCCHGLAVWDGKEDSPAYVPDRMKADNHS